MMNYWCRKAIKYPKEEDTYLSTDGKKVFEKVEPNQEKGKAIYEIFNRVWYDVMSQGLKYLKEENMEEIIASYTYHTTSNTLKNSKYSEGIYKYSKHIKHEWKRFEPGENRLAMKL
jgi:hypothetical protein